LYFKVGGGNEASGMTVDTLDSASSSMSSKDGLLEALMKEKRGLITVGERKREF
jgi:hypothetical protein